MNKNDKQPCFDSSTAYDDSEDDKVFRGGSWLNSARCARVANRDRYVPTDRVNFLGFRLVRGDT